MRVYLDVLKIMLWYHCSISCLVLSAIIYIFLHVVVGIGCGVMDSLTCNIPDAPLRLTSTTSLPFVFTLRCVDVDVAVHTSSHRFPMEIIAPGWRWGEICAVSSLEVNKGLRFSYALLVLCIRIPSGKSI